MTQTPIPPSSLLSEKRIDGKLVAENLLAQVAEKVAQLQTKPGLAVVLVGEDPASQVYVNKKIKTAAKAGIHSEKISLNAATSEATLLKTIEDLNQNPAIHGILVQLPLPSQINTQAVIEAITPAKDVDGFHPVNAGKLSCGLASGSVPCTPKGVMTMLEHYSISPAGKHAVIIGRSNIVGKPMAQLLLNANATVTICHSRTLDIPTITKTADIVVAAVGKPEWVTGDWLKPGAVVIDVGINRTTDGKLVGDVDFNSAAPIASYITPVPGGVGPMTVATLMDNTLNCYLAQQK